MEEAQMSEPKSTFNHNILIGVDDSENSRRAVNYVGQMLTGAKKCKITLLHIIPEPEEDFFRTCGIKTGGSSVTGAK
jgi:hypothetical protein